MSTFTTGQIFKHSLGGKSYFHGNLEQFTYSELFPFYRCKWVLGSITLRPKICWCIPLLNISAELSIYLNQDGLHKINKIIGHQLRVIAV